MAEKKIQWNKAQVKAIESRDGSVLVSAAAGSGKTAVLVERVIERICLSLIHISEPTRH